MLYPEVRCRAELGPITLYDGAHLKSLGRDPLCNSECGTRSSFSVLGGTVLLGGRLGLNTLILEVTMCVGALVSQHLACLASLCVPDPVGLQA